MSLCNCNEDAFMYTDVSKGVCVEECARSEYVLMKNKESKIMIKKGGGKKPCSYKKVATCMVDMMDNYAKLNISLANSATPLPNPRRAEWSMHTVALTQSAIPRPEGVVKLLEGGVSQVNRNYLIWYVEKHNITVDEKITQKIREIDTFLLKTLNSILTDFPRNPSHSYIYEMVQFFEKYTFTPKKYLNDILEKIHSKDGKKYTIMFYKWSKGFHKYLVKNGFCYVPPIFVNNAYDKELITYTPEIHVCEPKKGFEMPPLMLEDGNSHSNSHDELFESDEDDDDAKSAKSSGGSELASDDDKADEEMSDYDKSDSDESESDSEDYEEEQPESSSKAVKD